jgi:hypothetical protein
MTARIARTAEEFDALGDESLVLAIEIMDPSISHWRSRTLWRRFGRDWYSLDPSDRSDGEEGQPSGYLANMLTGFGSKNRTPGLALVLEGGEEIPFAALDDLPPKSVISIDGREEYIFTHDGAGRWTEMDPSDRDDGEFPALTAQLAVYGHAAHVLYRPGDEDAAEAAQPDVPAE